MSLKGRWASSENNKIHYLESAEYDKFLMPLIYVPGALNFAEQSTELMGEFIPRRRITMSLRGRGKSDAPRSGYSLNDHVQDIQTVISHSGVDYYCLMAYSMGVPYAIKFASEQPTIKALILCDYPAKYPSIPETWSDRIIRNGFIDEEKKHVVLGMQKESREINLYEELSQIKVPVLVIKGGKEGSLLKAIEVENYVKNLSNVRVCELSASGHELWEPNKEKFIEIIKGFLEELDSS